MERRGEKARRDGIEERGYNEGAGWSDVPNSRVTTSGRGAETDGGYQKDAQTLEHCSIRFLRR